MLRDDHRGLLDLPLESWPPGRHPDFRRIESRSFAIQIFEKEMGAMTQYNPSDELRKSVDTLIAELYQIILSDTSVENPRANTNAVITAIRKFGCILAVLSRDAERQTRRIVRLT
jgi:hypothetical protein